RFWREANESRRDNCSCRTEFEMNPAVAIPHLSFRPKRGEVIARLEAIYKIYQKSERVDPVYALNDINLSIHEGEMLAIMGASGSGKSTLMIIVGCLDRPTHGRYFLDQDDVATFSDDRLSEFRGRRLGFIFQNFNLIPQLTVAENLEVPL